MAALKDHGVIISKLDYSENSQVLAVFTRAYGKVRLIAKGVKRSTRARFAPGLDLLELGHVVFTVRQPRQEALAPLTEWRCLRTFNGLRERLERIYAAQYAAGLTARLTEDWDPHPGLYDALVTALTALNASEATLGTVVCFQRRLLTEIGLVPVLDGCVGCQRALPARGPLHFSANDGGVLCRDCEVSRVEKIGMDRRVLAVLAGQIDADAMLPSAFAVFDYYLSHLMGKPLPLAAMYRRVFAGG